MLRFKSHGILVAALLGLWVTGCGEAPKKGNEPGMESKGSLEHKGKGNESRPAPPAPPAIQPIK